MRKISNLEPTGNGLGKPASGVRHKDITVTGHGGSGHSRSSGNNAVRYTGETYSNLGATDSYTSGLEPVPNLIKSIYQNVEGSLYWLHAKQKIRFPYDIVCLGYSEEYDDESFLTIEQTKELMEYLYSVYSNSDLALATGFSRSRLSNYKRGVSRAPLELQEFAKRLKQAA